MLRNEIAERFAQKKKKPFILVSTCLQASEKVLAKGITLWYTYNLVLNCDKNKTPQQATQALPFGIEISETSSDLALLELPQS